MIDTAPHRLDLETLRRAFDAADSDGVAALNALLYASGALMMSAVLLIATSPPAVAVALATVPWLVLVVAAWLWVQPAVRDQLSAAREHVRQAEHVRARAADVLLDDFASEEERQAAARIMLDRREA